MPADKPSIAEHPGTVKPDEANHHSLVRWIAIA